MSVYVDDMCREFGRMKMCHMVADSVDELHAMADKIGVQRKWFQNKGIPHYDICLSKISLALSCGAIKVSQRELVQIARKAKKETPREQK